MLSTAGRPDRIQADPGLTKEGCVVRAAVPYGFQLCPFRHLRCPAIEQFQNVAGTKKTDRWPSQNKPTQLVRKLVKARTGRKAEVRA